MKNKEKFLATLKKLFDNDLKDDNIEQIQIQYDHQYLYVSTKKPAKTINPMYQWETSADQDEETKLWIWTF